MKEFLICYDDILIYSAKTFAFYFYWDEKKKKRKEKVIIGILSKEVNDKSIAMAYLEKQYFSLIYCEY